MSRKARRLGFIFGGKNNAEADQVWPYRVRDDYLSPEQTSFFRKLLSAVGDTYIIIPRVNMSDIFWVLNPEDGRNFSKYISEKRIDFLLCDRETMKPLVGVELDGQSHYIEKPPEQGIYIDDIFEAAKLPLVRIFLSNPNNPQDLRERLLEAAGRAEEERAAENDTLPETEWGGEPVKDKANDHFPISGLTDPLFKMAEHEPVEQTEEQLKLPDLQREELLKMPGLQPEEPLGEPVLIPEEPLKIPELQPEMLLSTVEPVRNPALPELDPTLQENQAEADRGVIPGTGHVEDKPLPGPVERRFLNSQAEQTPGVDFFTGSVSNVESPLPADEINAGCVEKILEESAVGEGRRESQEGRVLPNLPSVSLNLEQLKERMKQEVEQAAQAALQSGAPACLRCNATMVLRTSKRGHQFYVCANYPYCREVRGLLE